MLERDMALMGQRRRLHYSYGSKQHQHQCFAVVNLFPQPQDSAKVLHNQVLLKQTKGLVYFEQIVYNAAKTMIC
jgi:hypothetical protein